MATNQKSRTYRDFSATHFADYRRRDLKLARERSVVAKADFVNHGIK
jgi:hypothetical protein